MLYEINKMIRAKKYGDVVALFKSSEFNFSKSILFNIYFAHKKNGKNEDTKKFFQRVEKIAIGNKLERKFADWKYLATYNFLFSEKTVNRLHFLNNEIVLSDEAVSQLDSELLDNFKTLEKLISDCGSMYEYRYIDEYRFVKSDPLDFFPYKYISEFNVENYSRKVAVKDKLKISFVYCVKSRPVRFLLSLKSLRDAIVLYQEKCNSLEFEVVISEDVSSTLIPNLDQYTFEGDIAHYVIDTGVSWTRSGTLNFGIKRATGDVVVFCDVDFLFQPDFFILNEKSLLTFDFKKHILAVNCIETHTHHKSNVIYSKCSPYGYMWMVDLDLCKKVNGFSEQYIGHGFEDRDFQYKMTKNNNLTLVGSLAIEQCFFMLHLSHNSRVGEGTRNGNKNILNDRLLENNFHDDGKWGEFPLISYNKYNNSKKIFNTSVVVDYELAVLAHNSYHAWTYSLIKPYLDSAGLRSILLSPLPNYQDEGVEKFCADHSISFLRCCDMGDARNYSSLLVFNDWDKRVSNPLVIKFNELKLPTIGLIEGINDYDDVDTGRVRHAYRTVTNLLVPGDFDRDNYFSDIYHRSHVVGIPRMAAISKNYSPKLGSENEKYYVLINANFTYGVLEDARDKWISDAVLACIENGLSYKLTIHQADKGDYSNYIVSSDTFYNDLNNCKVLISRFSSCILEALIKKINVIYYNDGFEKVNKFQDSGGAYLCPISESQLIEFLPKAWTDDFPEKKASVFLEKHAATSLKSELEIVNSIIKILKQ